MFVEEPVYGTRGMITSMHYLATQAGFRMLVQGGNAVDAAIAAGIAMTVLIPPACSAGGDMFLLFWDAKTKQLHALNGSGRAPRNISTQYFASRKLKKIPWRGPLSVTVPGAVDGWFEAMARFGTLTPETIFSPAIEFAENGVPTSQSLSTWLANDARSILQVWGSDPAKFLPNGIPPKAGELLYQPALADTYRLLMKEGRDVFYRGSLAQSLVKEVERRGGLLTQEDMDQHRSTWVEPLTSNYRGYDVYEFPPNSQGIIALEMLNILEGFDLASLGYQTAPYLHILIEAARLAFADRDAYISDPEFVDIPIEQLLCKEYAERQRSRISMEQAAPYFDPAPEREADTITVCVADQEGNIALLMESLGSPFGSGILVEDTGIFLHNRGSYFSLDPRHPNYLRPKKRTMHTFMPAMVMQDGIPIIALGSIGGDIQPQIQVQLLSALIDFGFNAQKAITAPRWRSRRIRRTPKDEVQELNGQREIDEYPHQHITEVVILEERFPKTLIAQLQQLGHQIVVKGPWDHSMGPTQAIAFHPHTHVYEGASDPRNDSLALGW